MKYIFLFVIFMTFICADAELVLKFRAEKGLIYNTETLYTNSWQIQKKNRTLTSKAAAKYIKFYSISIAKRNGVTQEIFTLPPETNRLSWKIPKTNSNGIFIITVTAVPKHESFPRIRGVIHFYVTPAKPTLKLPKEFPQCLVVLMDWNGKRGFCKELTPTAALYYAQKTCKHIRQNFSSDEYEQYLSIIEKIENTPVADTTIYCSQKNATLEVDGHKIGFFENWDRKKKKYYLRFSLPIRLQKTYRIFVKKGYFTYDGFFLHSKNSEHVVNISKKINITIHSEIPFRITVLGVKTKWENKHVFQEKQGKASFLYLEFKDEKLRIDFVAKRKEKWFIKKNEQYFYLNIANKNHPFINNKVSLLDF
ncbi:hypothetical protein [Candidatus Uabimicrobium sp. HlEnr_7]|uniref:hypothetical protein n=1 Tax=Candidatus Uabimicrobium helgolandensis TaxID=3095367 RepID=UPI00355753BB